MMLYFMIVHSVTKELRLKGKVSARSTVPTNSYDVTAGEQTFRGLLVAEPHVNSSTPHRVLSVKCHLDAFGLEGCILDCLRRKRPCKLAFLKPPDFRGVLQGRAEFLRPTDSFNAIVSSMYKHVTIDGRLQPASDEELDAAIVREDCCIVIEAKSEADVIAKLGHQRQPVRLRTSGTQAEIYFADQTNIADVIAKLLKEGKTCRIPVQVNDSPGSADPCSVTAGRVRVKRRSSAEHLGQFVITTFPVDQNGNVVRRSSPNVSHWRVTWAPASGQAHAHPPVYRSGLSLDFDAEAQAFDGCKLAIKKYFDSANPADIDVDVV